MIGTIHVNGYHGITNSWLKDLTALTVLVGPIGSGKSTILEALHIGATPDAGDPLGPIMSTRPGLPTAARWLFWRGTEHSAPHRSSSRNR